MAEGKRFELPVPKGGVFPEQAFCPQQNRAEKDGLNPRGTDGPNRICSCSESVANRFLPDAGLRSAPLLGFDTRPDFARIKAKVLYVLCRTDALFPPKIAPDVIKALTAAGVEARYFELDSELGHSSSGAEHAKWSPVLREFLAPLVARLN